MGIRELSVDLTDEQKALRDAARKFFGEVWRPASIALDKLPSAEDVIQADSILWDIFRQTRELGYHKMSIPEAFGGMGMQDPVASALLAEEMGYAAPGLAVSWSVNGSPFTYAMLSPDPAVQDLVRQYCDDTEMKMTGCWAITEPDHGSDWILFEGENAVNPKCGGQVKAVLDGDEYVLNGQKAAWVSNGTIAGYASLFVNVDSSKGQEGGGVAVAPLNLPGVSRGKPLEKIGQRDLNQGEIFFDNVRIPKSMMIVQDPAAYMVTINGQLGGANMWMGCVFSGTARSAYDEALNYARERIQGGRPIIEHQNIKLKLFDMFTSVEAARSLSRRVWVYNVAQRQAMQPPAVEYSIASKVLGTETSFRVASQAVQIFGGNGLTKEYVIEKIFRDARAAMIEDGVNETLALLGANTIMENNGGGSMKPWPCSARTGFNRKALYRRNLETAIFGNIFALKKNKALVMIFVYPEKA